MRTNKGKPSGQYLAQLGNWNLYQTADGRYKVCAVDPVNGKANYAFGVDGIQIDSHAALDCAKLRAERPELFNAIEEHFRTAEVVPSSEPTGQQPVDEGDPYGDIALSRRRQPSPEQNWKRGLLQMRRIELEHRAANKPSIWESAVRMLWAALFGTRIDDSTAEKAIAWITQHQGEISLSVLLQIETDFYAGKYAPNSSSTLESQLDMLAGNFESLTMEATTNERTNEGSDSAGPMRSDDAGVADPFNDFL